MIVSKQRPCIQTHGSMTCAGFLFSGHGRYSGQDSGSNWHEREGGNGAAEIILQAT